MAEYIEKQEAAIIPVLPKEHRKYQTMNLDDAYENGWYDALECVEKLPPADVKPVVTCGKCKYGKYTGASWFCDKHSGHADKFGEDASYHEYHSKYWFCADGEEKNHA